MLKRLLRSTIQSKDMEDEEWFVGEVRTGLQEVEQGKVATDKEVKEAFGKWGVDAR